MENNPQFNTDSAVRRILKNDITILISIIVGVYAFVTLIILPLKSNEKEIDIIKTNHLVHIEASINEIKAELKENNSFHSDTDKKLERIITILEDKVK